MHAPGPGRPALLAVVRSVLRPAAPSFGAVQLLEDWTTIALMTAIPPSSPDVVMNILVLAVKAAQRVVAENGPTYATWPDRIQALQDDLIANPTGTSREPDPNGPK